MRALPASRVPSLAVAACLVIAAGCTNGTDSPASPETGVSPVTSAPPSTPAGPTGPETNGPETNGTTGTTTPPQALPLLDRLLPTAQVPGLNAQWHWQDGDTGQPTTEPFGLCAMADLLSIGATEVVARSYFPPDDSDDNAAEQVAEFPDARTARLAWSVLGSWHDACAKKRRANPGLLVSKVAPVPVSNGSARYYLLSWTPAGEEVGRFEEFGMVLNGTRIAVLRIDTSSQGQDYVPGKEPMVGMVRAAGGWLD
jgi:hypothetical protein